MKLREVTGLMFSPKGYMPTKITVRISNDAIGKSLSLADERIGFMLEIPLEPLEDLIEVKS